MFREERKLAACATSSLVTDGPSLCLWGDRFRGFGGMLSAETQNTIQKQRIADHVSFPHPTRLLRYAIDPFQTDFAHPDWSSSVFPRIEIKQSADAHCYTGVDSRARPGNPFLLMRNSHSDHQNIGLQGIDLGDYFVF